MSWNASRSRERIKKHLGTVPAFDGAISLMEHARQIRVAKASQTLDNVSPRRAFVVEGAHVYGHLLDFDSLVVDQQSRETEGSHSRLLGFLDMHYKIWDAVVDGEDADRVDYHGSRLHAVVTSPSGDARGQIERAVALATKLTDVTKRVAAAFGFPARIRFGIDQGRCLAMTTGRAHEQDTLFLGPPANHAAKAAAGGDQEGIFLSDGSALSVGANSAKRTPFGDAIPETAFLREATAKYPFERIDRIGDRIIAEAAAVPQFVFHRTTPPLSQVDFSKLTPSNSVRMGMASLFADIDGFTAFVDQAIARGTDSIKRAATAIHVIREELNSVLKDDFGGKRVRFIGDCIHGLLAEDANQDDAPATVREAAVCATGMKSSFDLCKEVLGEIDKIDLAIGVEYGPVPLTRLGNRGLEGIRCATGKAVVVSERVQRSMEGGGIRFGPNARAAADDAVVQTFSETAASIPSYDAAVDLLGTSASPAFQILKFNPEARPHGVAHRQPDCAG